MLINETKVGGDVHEQNRDCCLFSWAVLPTGSYKQHCFTIVISLTFGKVNELFQVFIDKMSMFSKVGNHGSIGINTQYFL